MTPEQILELAKEAGFSSEYTGEDCYYHRMLLNFSRAIVLRTREECAKVCRDMQSGFASDQHIECAEAIEGMK